VVAVSRRVQTLLFTDIVGSTDRLRDLGDAAWAALLARHHEAIRAVVAAMVAGRWTPREMGSWPGSTLQPQRCAPRSPRWRR